MNETKEYGKEEGDVCNRDGCDGVIEWSKPDNCSCHINPPCSSCLETYLLCPKCGWDDEEK